MKIRVAVVVPAGGLGRRMGGVKKQYLELAGAPLLLHTLRPFLEHPDVEWVVVPLPPEDAAAPPSWMLDVDPRITLVAGGDERGDSVARALESVPPEADIVIIHDAARPLVSRAIIDRTIRVAARGHGAVAAIPVGDTIKEVDAGGVVTATPDRNRLWRAQTPQAFPRALIQDAYRRAAEEGIHATDDAALVERIGGRVLVVDGAPENLKVTGPADIIVAEALLPAGGGPR
jgi:2-C-methyl-D-erythritol 4-phosphate cytidylyltransferase